MIKSALAILCVLFIANTYLAQAGESYITNTISVSSNSGGNSASNGAIVQGTTTSTLNIETIVDGEVVAEVHETHDSEQVYVEEVIVVNEKESVVKTGIVINGELKEKVEISMPKEERIGILERLSSFIAYVFSIFRT